MSEGGERREEKVYLTKKKITTLSSHTRVSLQRHWIEFTIQAATVDLLKHILGISYGRVVLTNTLEAFF